MDRVAWRDWQELPCASALLRFPADWDFNKTGTRNRDMDFVSLSKV